VIDVLIVSIAKYGHQTIKKPLANYTMNKVFILIDLSLQSALKKYQENINKKSVGGQSRQTPFFSAALFSFCVWL
jgi:hypothetical protein